MRICNPSKLLSQPRIIMLSPFIGLFIWFINTLNSISAINIEYLMAFNHENQYNL